MGMKRRSKPRFPMPDEETLKKAWVEGALARQVFPGRDERQRAEEAFDTEAARNLRGIRAAARILLKWERARKT